MQDARAALSEHLHSITGDCVAVECCMARTYRRVTRLALLNESHSVSHFLLAERGLAKYPPYSLHRTRSAFHCLEQMEEYEAALEVCNSSLLRPGWLLLLRYSLSALLCVQQHLAPFFTALHGPRCGALRMCPMYCGLTSMMHFFRPHAHVVEATSHHGLRS